MFNSEFLTTKILDKKKINFKPISATYLLPSRGKPNLHSNSNKFIVMVYSFM